MKSNYVAVTIGPIFDTMSLVSTPAALWASSYMFSCITKTICKQLLEHGVKEEDIITPYFSQTDTELLDKKDGVGLFHDRIIFATNDFDIKKFNQIKKNTLEKIADIFELDLTYLEQYVQIAAVKYEAENPISGCDKILNSRELEKPFVAKDTKQPLLKMLFAGNDSADERNKQIKEIAKKLGLDKKWQLLSGENIKDLNMIINPTSDTTMKKHRYYAIVRSDGDNMSKIIANLKGNDDFRKFSRTCLEYCSDIAKEVANFGGVTIYAGGDDLLAILPCENKDGNSPFEFIKSANEIFEKSFAQYQQPTSLSCGITMCYYKFPLYEALDDSAGLLFGVAKDKKHKNCAVIRLQKHSGQSEGLLIPNSAMDELLALKSQITKNEISKDEKEERIIVSALHKLSLFKSLLDASDNNYNAIKTLFTNMFDSGEQDTKFLHATLPEFFYKLKTDVQIRALTDDGVQNDPVTSVAYVLRLLKFFNEKAGDTK
jgi:CRISPR-associated protein Cmr2